MLALFFAAFTLLILAELIKGLSANGTPPVLQKFSWQMDLAYFMWTNIRTMRIVLVIAVVVLSLMVPAQFQLLISLSGFALVLVWAGVYWVFNRYWVGKVKFPPISSKVFAAPSDNQVDLSQQVIGLDHNGEQKAFPVNMVFFHHQLPDEVGGHPIWVTYCGLCRSGRVYDTVVDDTALTFSLVGAISFNAVFQDQQTGSWWRQETGEAAKGPHQGRVLADFPFQQMSLKNWLDAHPNSTILQPDPLFAKKYNFIEKLLNYEASLPGWHMQKSPPMITGVTIGDEARAYDWKQLEKRKLVQDELGGAPIMLVAEPGGASAFVYQRMVDGDALGFELAEDGRMTDTKTGSTWDVLGRCTDGALAGQQLAKVQSYQQFLRAWITFHKNTSFYTF